jgi:hypothetical protein
MNRGNPAGLSGELPSSPTAPVPITPSIPYKEAGCNPHLTPIADLRGIGEQEITAIRQFLKEFCAKLKTPRWIQVMNENAKPYPSFLGGFKD